MYIGIEEVFIGGMAFALGTVILLTLFVML